LQERIRNDSQTANLLDGSEKCLGVEEAAQPERVRFAAVAPRAKLGVAIIQF